MNGLARILRIDEPVGAGFLISPLHVATCAHVVNAALPDRSERDQEPPDAAAVIAIDFPVDPPEPGDDKPPARRAKVLRWRPPPAAGAEPGPHDDIAVLLLDRAIDAALLPALADAPEQPAPKTAGSAWGTPRHHEGGLWADAVVSGAAGPAGSLRQINLAGGPEIRRGFSGGPFSDAAQHCILGMIAQIDEHEGASWMLPIATLLPVWAEPLTLAIDLRVEDGRLHAQPHGPAEGTDLDHLRQAIDADDPAPLYRALLGDLDLQQDLAALDPAFWLQGPQQPAKRLRLHCLDAAAAMLPWHWLHDANGARLGADGWIIEVTGPAQDLAPALTLALDTPLILAPATNGLAPAVHAHATEVAAELAPLLAEPRIKVHWAVNRRTLADALKLDPDLIYCYARLDAAGCLALGHDDNARESLCLEELIALVDERRPQRLHPPILWLHCVETGGARLDSERLFELTRDWPLVLIQRSRHPREIRGNLKRGTIPWLQALRAEATAPGRPSDAVPPATRPGTEPAAVLSRLGDNSTRFRLGQAGLALRCRASDDDLLYAHIRAALIQLLLGRTTEKDLLAGRIQAPRAAPLLLYLVCGDALACVHDFPDQGRWYLEEMDRTLRLRQRPFPAMLRTDQDTDMLERQLIEGLSFDTANNETTEEVLERIANPPPSPDETVIVSLAWLLTPDPDLEPSHIPDWIARWKAALLRVFPAREIPARCRVLAGLCLQWQDDWPERYDSTAAAIQRQAGTVLQRDNPEHCDWVRINSPLDRLEPDELDSFFRAEARRPCLRGLDRSRLVDWIMARTDGRFEPTVQLIHQGC